jgi:hypothetical protein
MNNHNIIKKSSNNGDLESNGKQAIEKNLDSNLKRSALQTSNEAKPLASLSLDLDNLWSYLKIHGDAGWENFPSYFDIFIPHVLDILDRWELKITFFIVGQDAALRKNQDFLREISSRGHEVGNHSFHHESWLQAYSKDQLAKEIGEAEYHIVKAVKENPIGFRGPGFSWSPDLLEVLALRGYLFDASTLPTYIGPLARLFYFWKSNLSREEKKERNELFGGMKAGFQPLKPYIWKLNPDNTLLEIPVTTIPVVKTPFHLSYLLYLSRFSSLLMQLYLSIAIYMCKITGTSPSYLLHPLDLIGGDKIKELAFFPGMDLTSEQKVKVFNKVIGNLSQNFNFVNMSTHAEHLLKNGNLKTVNFKG